MMPQVGQDLMDHYNIAIYNAAANAVSDIFP